MIVIPEDKKYYNRDHVYPNEQWVEVPYELYRLIYEVSNYGRVWSMSRGFIMVPYKYYKRTKRVIVQLCVGRRSKDFDIGEILRDAKVEQLGTLKREEEEKLPESPFEVVKDRSIREDKFIYNAF